MIAPLDRSRRPVRREPLKHGPQLMPLRRTIKPCARAYSVTVCMAAIANDSTAIVMLADRMISMVSDERTIMTADSLTRKIRDLQLGWVGLISGRIDMGEDVCINGVKDYLSSLNNLSTPSLNLPQSISFSHDRLRTQIIEDEILKPLLLDINWYHNRVIQEISSNDSFFWDIFRQIERFSSATSLLVCGFEDRIPDIFLICDRGQSNPGISQGFGVIGIGDDVARKRLFTLKTKPSDDIAKILYDLYDAKEACAEYLPDIGHDWDAVILVKDRDTVTVPSEIKELIENIYKSHQKSPFDTPKRYPPNWRPTLGRFTESLI